MIKYFTKAFKITNENIILTTPLVLFLFLLSIYLGIAKNAPETLLATVLLLVTILFMVSAFFSGWLFMVKQAVNLEKKEGLADEEKAKASLALLKEIPVGIGEYFLSFIGGLILYVGLIALMAFLGYQIGMHFIGKVGVNLMELKIALESPAAMKALVSSLSVEQLKKINEWNILFLSSMTLFSFITMFWGAQIVIKNKNPFVSFFQALGFTFRNIFPSIILFVYISLINFTVSLLNAVAGVNPILYFLSMLVYFYFVVYVVVLVFLYYDSENSDKLIIIVGKQQEQDDTTEDKSNSDSGSDSIGQDQSGDSQSQGD